MNQIKYFNIFILMLSCLLFFSCKNKSDEKKQEYIKINDDLNREVVFDKLPQRIISLAPNITEILFLLGCDESIVGVTKYCDYPERAKYKKRVGDLVSINLEVIVELKPDILFMTVEGNTKEVFNKIEKTGTKIFVTNPRNLDGVCKNVIDIGKITGNGNKSREIVNEIRNKIDSINNIINKVERPKVLLLVSLMPLMTIGKNTYLNEVLELSGAKNITSTEISNYPSIGREFVLKQDPDFIFVPSDLVVESSEVLKFYPEWKLTKASKNNNIYIIPADLIQRPGPRIADAVESIANLMFSKVH